MQVFFKFFIKETERFEMKNCLKLLGTFFFKHRIKHNCIKSLVPITTRGLRP